MQQHRQNDRHAGLHRPRPPGNEDEAVLDVRGFAARYVLLGIVGGRVRVRRKADGAVGTLAYRLRPLTFSCFLPEPGHKPPPTRPEARA